MVKIDGKGAKKSQEMQQLNQQVLYQRQFRHQNQAALAALQQNVVANQQQLAALPQNVTQLKVAQDVKCFLDYKYIVPTS